MSIFTETDDDAIIEQKLAQVYASLTPEEKRSGHGQALYAAINIAFTYYSSYHRALEIAVKMAKEFEE